jgi:hypothetical protein
MFVRNMGALEQVRAYRTRNVWRGLGQDDTFIDNPEPSASEVPIDQEPSSVPANSSPEGTPTNPTQEPSWQGTQPQQQTTTSETPPSQMTTPGNRPPSATAPSSDTGGLFNTIGKFFTTLFGGSPPKPGVKPGAPGTPGTAAADGTGLSPETTTLLVVGGVTVGVVLLVSLLTKPRTP